MENDRLLKALLISIVFHGLLFFAINMFDWFPEMERQDRYGPVTVVLEKPNYPEVKADNLMDQISEKEITQNEKPVPKPPVAVKQDKVDVPDAVTKDSDYDPYADIGTKSEPVLKDTSVEIAGNVDTDMVYVPVARDSIEYEVPVNGSGKDSGIGDSGVLSPSPLIGDKTNNTNSVISSNDISDLENALSSDNNNQSSVSVTDKTVYEYNDSPVAFDTEGINRKLISNPSPKLPDNLPDDFPKEITYKIRFSLNTDGLIKVLSITPSSVYPNVDTSIRNALRSWTFNRSAGPDDVKGTITLIFKGR